jgi:hypothetical protein
MASYDDNTLMDITELKGLQTLEDYDDITGFEDNSELDSFLRSVDRGFFENDY